MSAAGSRSFSPAALRWIVGIGSASFVIAVLLAAFAEDLGTPLTAGANSYSRSALGQRAFVELLARSGVAITRIRSRRGVAFDAASAILVAEPRPALAKDEEGIQRFREKLNRSLAGGTALVLVLPKWTGRESPQRPGWIMERKPLGAAAIQSLLESLVRRPGVTFRLAEGGPARMECRTSWGGTRKVQIPSPHLLEPSKGLAAVVSCGGKLLVARIAGGSGGGAYIVSDPDLVNNEGLGAAQNAAVAAGLFLDRLRISRLLIDERIHGFSIESGVLLEMFRYPLVLALVHGLLVAALLVWAGTGRFGRIETPPPALDSGKEVLIRNAAQLMRMAGITGRLLPSYLDGTIRSVAMHYGLPAESPRGVLLRRLGEIAKMRRVSIDLASLRRQADRFARNRNVNDAGALALARRIHGWREEMTDVH